MERFHHPDPIAAVVAAIRDAAAEDVDPYVLAGVLIEGVIHVIMQGVSIDKQVECGHAAAWLMVDRLRAANMLL